jgi:hypothetical protein
MALIITLLVPSPIRVLRVFASLVFASFLFALFIRTLFLFALFVSTAKNHSSSTPVISSMHLTNYSKGKVVLL